MPINYVCFLLVPCPIEGQFYTIDCFGTNATCANPNPPVVCDFPQCVCPRGQVIDEVTKTCINGSQCSKCDNVPGTYICMVQTSYNLNGTC